MKNKLYFILKYFAFWVFTFLCFKILFVVYHIDKFPDLPFIDYILIFVHGLVLDFSMTGYIMLVPVILIVISAWVGEKWIVKTMNVYTVFILLITSLLQITDLELYDYWGFRLDETFLDYIDTPKDMLASLSWYHYPILFTALFVCYLIFYRLIYQRWILDRNLVSTNHKWYGGLAFIIFLPVMIIPIRGGFSTSPVNTGAVYFHQNIMVNHAAINPVWNLLYTITENSKLNYTVNYFDKEKERVLLDALKSTKGRSTKVLNNKKPNVMIIILESFSAHVMKELGGVEGVTPNLSRFAHEGLLFTNFYSAHSSSSRGIGAILSNYPGLPNTCILYYENKTTNLPAISKDLKELGYKSRFYYGGDIDFAHIKSFLLNSGFDRIVSDKDFDKADYYSKWGVPDHKVFNHMLEETNEVQEPFFHVMFSLSSHEPFEVPMETVIPGNSVKEKHMNSIYYTDKSLGEFIDEAKQQPWWDNTLVILVADHGSRIDDMTYYDRDRHHIPMIWLGGALAIKDTVIDKYGVQSDISATLLNQMGIPHEGYIFSKDLLNDSTKSYAFYSCANGVGFVSDSLYLMYDMTGESYLQDDPKATDADRDRLKAYLQWLYGDFAGR